MRGRLLLPALLVGLTTCSGDGRGPITPMPEPGFLTVELNSPGGAPGAALLQLSGVGIDSLRSRAGDLFVTGGPDTYRLVIVGPLSKGPVIDFWVPDATQTGLYTVLLEQVSETDFQLADPLAYTADVVR